MVKSSLVDFVQNTYPPAESLPRPPADDGRNRLGQDPPFNHEPKWPPNLEAIDRPTLPDWVLAGQHDLVEEEMVAVSEGEPIASADQHPAHPDVLAYYLPFHFYETRWGIYVRASGIAAVAAMLGAATGQPAAEFSDLACQILIQHERFHFLTELACSRGEIASRQPIYKSYYSDRRAAALEEALANANAVRIALKRQPTVVHGAVEAWMRSQPPGYRDFERWLRGRSFDVGRRLISGAMISLVPGIGTLGPTEFLYGAPARTTTPMFFVRDAASIEVLRPFPKYLGVQVLVHTRDHPPPHFHLLTADGKAVTRLEWPILEPLKGDPSLSVKERRTLDSYLARFGAQISDRVRQVYGSAAA